MTRRRGKLHLPSKTPLFPLGKVVATPGALALLEEHGRNAAEFLLRHERGDWGDVGDQDKRANEDGLRHGARLLSVYPIADQSRLWIITEADRSSTCLLLPEEY